MSQYQARYESAAIRGFLPWMPGVPAPLKPYVRGDLVELNARIMAERAARPRGLDTGHGTPAGYRRHRRAGEQACVPCLEAERARNLERARERGRPTKSEAAKVRAAQYGTPRTGGAPPPPPMRQAVAR